MFVHLFISKHLLDQIKHSDVNVPVYSFLARARNKCMRLKSLQIQNSIFELQCSLKISKRN